MKVYMLKAAAIALALGLVGCVSNPFKQEVKSTDSSSRLDVTGVEKRSTDMQSRTRLIQDKLAAAQTARELGRLDEADASLKAVLDIEPLNQRAKDESSMVTRLRRHPQLAAEARQAVERGDVAVAEEKVREILLENPKDAWAKSMYDTLQLRKDNLKRSPPQLKTAAPPVSFEFRDTPIKVVFQALTNTTGISFILDKDIPTTQTVTMFIKTSAPLDILEALLTSNQLQKKVVNENTAQIYPNTPSKVKEYQELEMRSFYLANANPNQVASTISKMLEVKDMQVDDRSNLLIVRDTPEAMKQVERLVYSLDIAEPEVTLDLEVLEVNSTKLTNLGIKWPSQLSVLTADGGKTMTIDELFDGVGIKRKDFAVTPVPSATFSSTDSAINILSNPRVRVRNRERATIHVGDRVPIFTSTFLNGVTNATSVQNVQYLDVGLKLEVSPTVNIDNLVSIRLGLEVSSLGETVKGVNNAEAFKIGTRNASTVLTLKDGETQILAGLISDRDSASFDKVPGFGDLPLLGRLFGAKENRRDKTDILLAVTPHVIRTYPPPSRATTDVMLDTQYSMGRPTAADGKVTQGPAVPSLPPHLIQFANPGAIAPKPAENPASAVAAPAAPVAAPAVTNPPPPASVTGVPGIPSLMNR